MPLLKYIRLDLNRLEATPATAQALEELLAATSAIVAISGNPLASIQAKLCLFERPEAKLMRLIWIHETNVHGRFWHHLLDTRKGSGEQLAKLGQDIVQVHEKYYALARRWDHNDNVEEW
jgi:hypothetical protein